MEKSKTDNMTNDVNEVKSTEAVSDAVRYEDAPIDERIIRAGMYLVRHRREPVRRLHSVSR